VDMLLTGKAGAVNPLDEWRTNIMLFVLHHWEKLRPQLGGCAASTRRPDACFYCTDMQVIACLAIENENNIEEIRKHGTHKDDG